MVVGELLEATMRSVQGDRNIVVQHVIQGLTSRLDFRVYIAQERNSVFVVCILCFELFILIFIKFSCCQLKFCLTSAELLLDQLGV
jgi:hypothetical protein